MIEPLQPGSLISPKHSSGVALFCKPVNCGIDKSRLGADRGRHELKVIKMRSFRCLKICHDIGIRGGRCAAAQRYVERHATGRHFAIGSVIGDRQTCLS